MTLLFCLSVSATSYAAKTPTSEELYEIEVLVFTQVAPKEIEAHPEYWPETVKFPVFNTSRELLSPYEYLLYKDQLNPRHYVAESLEDSSEDLSNLSDAITRRKELSLLLHKKWIQSLDEDEKTSPVYVTDTNQPYLYQPFTPEFIKSLDSDQTPTEVEVAPEQQLLQQLLKEEKLLNQPVQEQEGFISDMDPIEAFDQMNFERPTPVVIPETFGPPQHKIFGLIKLFKARYPHLAIDLFYRDQEVNDEVAAEKTDKEPFPMQAKSEAVQEVVKDEAKPESEGLLLQEKPPRAAYPLNVSTRIRYDEIHYFDHPKFGVMTRVKKYEPPEEKAAAKK